MITTSNMSSTPGNRIMAVKLVIALKKVKLQLGGAQDQ